LILDRILVEKRKEVEALRERYRDWRPPAAPPVRRDFRAALRGEGIALIAEFKRRSPSRGEIRPAADPIGMARSYEAAGAAALSVLTDERFFGGSLADLNVVRGAVELPVLRKDFIIDPCQVAESALPEGPDALLLIAAALEGERLRSLRRMAELCGQAALVEVHTEQEVDRALESGAEIIGINNRDLRTFEVSLDTTFRLRPRIPSTVTVVAESGVHSRDDVVRLSEAGVDAVLVGEALMTADDPGEKIQELLGRRAWACPPYNGS
jgi:indole-3-glycerol phosphate synthase